MFLCSMFALCISAGDENLFLNPDFKVFPYAKGKITALYSPWYTTLKFDIDKGMNGGRALCGKTSDTEKTKNNQLSAEVNIPKPGKYIVTINYKADAPVELLRCLRVFKNSEGKDDYQVFVQEQPEPGKWGTLMAEFEFKEPKKTTFAFQAHTKHATTIWWNSPSIVQKEE